MHFDITICFRAQVKNIIFVRLEFPVAPLRQSTLYPSNLSSVPEELVFEQVWTHFFSAFNLLLFAPFGDESVISAQQNLWNIETTPV